MFTEDQRKKHDEAWAAYERWNGITLEQLKLIRDDLERTHYTLKKIEPSDGIVSSSINARLIHIDNLIELRKRK